MSIELILMKDIDYSDRLFTLRRTQQWDDMLEYLSKRLVLQKSSVVRLAVANLYEIYQNKDDQK